MKNILYTMCIALFIISSSIALAGEQDVTISVVGVSNNTNSVFINTVEELKDSTCNNKKLARLPIQDVAANYLLSVGLAAQAQDKKITLLVSQTECISGGALVEVFLIKSEL